MEALVRSIIVLSLAVGLAACGGEPRPQHVAAPGGSPASPATPVSPVVSPELACSGASVPGPLTEGEGLPAAVSETREEIAEAARDCDYEALKSLALAGSAEFTYSFGERGDPGRFWRGEERRGEEPLRFLVELLDRPFATQEVGGGVHYVWPSAFAYGDWARVPEDHREALRPLYGDKDFAGFQDFGAYLGYRVGITEEGDWVFFVAGD
jgi:hypothetical protein